MPKKTTRKPKLICKTPWLKRQMVGWADEYWASRGKRAFLCCPALARIFPIPKTTKRLRAFLWDSRPGPDAVQMRFRFPGWCSCASYLWTTSLTGAPTAKVAYCAAKLLKEGLFADCEAPTIKTAWLAIEIED